jgi:SAM-dependent methyltransferase
LTRLRRSIAGALRRAAERIERPGERGVRSLAHQIVGGAWDEMGRAQFDFLVGRGLRPTDTMLDIGCGALRGGVHFVRYLDPGNYYGVDRAQWLLDVGRTELADAGLSDRGAHLRCDDSFDFEALGQTFDVALAQSVFTHVNLNVAHRCLVRTAAVLRPGAVFYATILENTGDPHDLSPITFDQPDMAPTVTFPDKNPFRYHVRFFEDLIVGLPLRLEYVGEWGSLRGQSMLAFHRV